MNAEVLALLNNNQTVPLAHLTRSSDYQHAKAIHGTHDPDNIHIDPEFSGIVYGGGGNDGFGIWSGDTTIYGGPGRDIGSIAIPGISRDDLFITAFGVKGNDYSVRHPESGQQVNLVSIEELSVNGQVVNHFNDFYPGPIDIIL